MKLHRNFIGDIGAGCLAELFQIGAFRGLDELHSSHNQLTSEGALNLMTSAASTSNRRPPKSPPLWLRLDATRRGLFTQMQRKPRAWCYIRPKRDRLNFPMHSEDILAKEDQENEGILAAVSGTECHSPSVRKYCIVTGSHYCQVSHFP